MPVCKRETACEYSNQNFVWWKGQLKGELECGPAQPTSSYPDLAWQDYIIKCKLLLYLCLHVLAQHAFIMFHSLHANCNFMLVYCRHMFYKIILIFQLLRHKMKTTVKISIEDKYHEFLDLYCQTPGVRQARSCRLSQKQEPTQPHTTATHFSGQLKIVYLLCFVSETKF